jgi:hypothetical protein
MTFRFCAAGKEIGGVQKNSFLPEAAQAGCRSSASLPPKARGGLAIRKRRFDLAGGHDNYLPNHGICLHDGNLHFLSHLQGKKQIGILPPIHAQVKKLFSSGGRRRTVRRGRSRRVRRAPGRRMGKIGCCLYSNHSGYPPGVVNSSCSGCPASPAGRAAS